MGVFGFHGYAAYTTIASINAAASLETQEPVSLLSFLTTNGIDIPPTVAVNSRQPYRQAMEQYVLYGAGVCLSFILALLGVFIYLNL